MKIIFITLLLSMFSLEANENLWSPKYQDILMEKIGGQMKTLSTYPSIKYPSSDIQQILKKYPNGKVLLFGYGSLMNPTSAARSVSPEAVKSMKPALAFGLKRIFNYKAGNVSRWGSDLPENEKAMLNIEPMTTYNHAINGVVMEVSAKDLAQLVEREVGYDLVPVIVANWDHIILKHCCVKMKIAYTFYVPDELRQGIDYTQTEYYPVRGYLHAVQDGAAIFGDKFLNYWNKTTYLSDGTTSVKEWDEQTFSGILDTKKP